MTRKYVNVVRKESPSSVKVFYVDQTHEVMPWADFERFIGKKGYREVSGPQFCFYKNCGNSRYDALYCYAHACQKALGQLEPLPTNTLNERTKQRLDVPPNETICRFPRCRNNIHSKTLCYDHVKQLHERTLPTYSSAQLPSPTRGFSRFDAPKGSTLIHGKNESIIPGHVKLCSISWCDNKTPSHLDLCTTHGAMQSNNKLDDESFLELLGDGNCKVCGDAGKQINHDLSCCKDRYSCGECVRALLCLECNFRVKVIEQGVSLLRGIDRKPFEDYLLQYVKEDATV